MFLALNKVGGFLWHFVSKHLYMQSFHFILGIHWLLVFLKKNHIFTTSKYRIAEVMSLVMTKVMGELCGHTWSALERIRVNTDVGFCTVIPQVSHGHCIALNWLLRTALIQRLNTQHGVQLNLCKSFLVIKVALRENQLKRSGPKDVLKIGSFD